MSALPPAARSDRRLAAWLVFVLLFAAIAYAGRFTLDEARTEDIFYTWDLFVGGVVQFALMLAVAVAIAWRGPARALLAIRPPRSWARAAGMMLAILLLVIAIAAGLEPLVQASEEQGLVPEGWNPERAAPFAANAVLAAAIAPVVEELIFRGVGFTLLLRFGRVAAIVVTGVLFGLAHGLLNALPILVAFGIALGWLRSRADSVLPCIALHGAFNAFALLGAVLVGEGGSDTG